jgi:hypothetical protein
MYMNREDRRIVRAYLEEALKKLGYSVGQYFAGHRLNIDLKTRDNFAAATGRNPDDKLQIQVADGVIWRAPIGSLDENDTILPRRVSVARVGDPQCAAKVAKFVVEYHIALLKHRLLLHSTYSEEVDGTIARLSKSLACLNNPAE